MNLIFSYSATADRQLDALGHIFIGAGEDEEGSEIHVFLKKDTLLSNNGKQIQFIEAAV